MKKKQYRKRTTITWNTNRDGGEVKHTEYALCSLSVSSFLPISLSLYPSSETLNSIDASDTFTHCSSVEYIHSLYVCPWAWAYHFIKLIQFAVCFSFSAVSISFTQFLVSSVCWRCHLLTIHHRCPWLWLIQCKCFFLYFINALMSSSSYDVHFNTN